MKPDKGAAKGEGKRGRGSQSDAEPRDRSRTATNPEGKKQAKGPVKEGKAKFGESSGASKHKESL